MLSAPHCCDVIFLFQTPCRTCITLGFPVWFRVCDSIWRGRCIVQIGTIGNHRQWSTLQILYRYRVLQILYKYRDFTDSYEEHLHPPLCHQNKERYKCLQTLELPRAWGCDRHDPTYCGIHTLPPRGVESQNIRHKTELKWNPRLCTVFPQGLNVMDTGSPQYEFHKHSNVVSFY